MDPRDQLIVALDFPTERSAMELVHQLAGSVRWVKVGLELYLAAGSGIVRALQAHNLRVFLDLKLHDIPNTVAAAVRVCGDTGADLLTIHAAGGPAMIAAAAQAAPPSLRLLAVTVLTSMDAPELAMTGIRTTPAEQVLKLGTMAVAAGAHGLVCSPAEIETLRQSTARGSHLVVPGIRPSGFPADDQRRTATAAEAVRSGASQVVVGRPITRSADPVHAATELLAELAAVKNVS